VGRHVRAFLLLLHVIAVALMAVPAPEGGMSRAAWKDPTVQGEFDAWVTRLRAWGVPVRRDRFEAQLWEFAVAYTDTRKALLAPFSPYYDYAGTRQSWRMFVAPHRFPARLHIDIREGGKWRPIYVERSDDAVWMRRMLDHDRFRSAVFRYSWPQYRKTYEQFCTWLAKRAAHDFPGADRLRVRYFKYRTPSPEVVRAGAPVDGKFIRSRELPIGGGP
jgi:hypothetical protein